MKDGYTKYLRTSHFWSGGKKPLVISVQKDTVDSKRWAVGRDVKSHALKQKPTAGEIPCQKWLWKSFHVLADQKVTELFRWCSRRRTQYDHSMHPPEIQFWALLHNPSRDLIWKFCTHSQLCVLNKDGLKPYTYIESEKNYQDYEKKK